jgi:hypothetical protein
MDEIAALARAHSLRVIEDGAHAIGTQVDGRQVARQRASVNWLLRDEERHRRPRRHAGDGRRARSPSAAACWRCTA